MTTVCLPLNIAEFYAKIGTAHEPPNNYKFHPTFNSFNLISSLDSEHFDHIFNDGLWQSALSSVWTVYMEQDAQIILVILCGSEEY